VIPSRNVWHPLERSPRAPALPLEPLDQDEPADIDQQDAKLSGVDEEDAEPSDAEFYRQMRADIEGVRAGVVRSMTDAMRPALQQRPWSKRHKRRDRYGRVIGRLPAVCMSRFTT